MSLFNQLFNRNTITPLMQRNDTVFEVKYQTGIIDSKTNYKNCKNDFYTFLQFKLQYSFYYSCPNNKFCFMFYHHL